MSYKVAFAVRHPDQVLPYARRLATDAFLRARTRDHVSYYRAVMKSRASRSVYDAVGSSGHDEWVEFGQMQFDYLVKHGLMPADRVLEIGCGNLRAGRLLIGYLDKGSYYGIDISPDILFAAQKALADYGLQGKMAILTPVQDLTFSFLPDDYFTVVNANSVFTHCPLAIIDECLAHVGRIMVPGGIFDFTFYRAEDAEYDVYWEDFYYRTETFLELARKYGLDARLMDDWDDPWERQLKIRLTRPD